LYVVAMRSSVVNVNDDLVGLGGNGQ